MSKLLNTKVADLTLGQSIKAGIAISAITAISGLAITYGPAVICVARDELYKLRYRGQEVYEDEE